MDPDLQKMLFARFDKTDSKIDQVSGKVDVLANDMAKVCERVSLLELRTDRTESRLSEHADLLGPRKLEQMSEARKFWSRWVVMTIAGVLISAASFGAGLLLHAR